MTYWLFGVDASFVPGRLLTWGLPLTVMFGAAVAAFMFTGLSIWEAALVGAILAPTDAALGQVVVTNPRVPQSSRTLLPGSDLIVTLTMVTVGLSIYAHGATSWFGSESYGRWHQRQQKGEQPLDLPAGNNKPEPG